MAQPKPFEHWSRKAKHPPAAVLTPEESRQGVVSGRVVTILATSLLLAGMAFVIVYAMFF